MQHDVIQHRNAAEIYLVAHRARHFFSRILDGITTTRMPVAGRGLRLDAILTSEKRHAPRDQFLDPRTPLFTQRPHDWLVVDLLPAFNHIFKKIVGASAGSNGAE